MTDEHDPDAEAANSQDGVARLIRTAGRRADPPRATYERALAAATVAWHTKLRRRAQRRAFGAIAASFVLVSTAALFVAYLQRASVPIIGRTDRIIGTVQLQTSPGDQWMALRDSTQGLSAGSQMRTGAGGRVGVMLASGVSLRLADATEVVLESGSRVRVLTGKIYLDTSTGYPQGAANIAGDARRIEVITAAGTASDIGTQFEVQYRDDAYRLRVREGHVLLQRTSGRVDGSAGEQLSIDARGTLERTRMPAQDTAWEWVESVAPAPDIDNKPVTVLLTWVARETGKSIRFDKPDVERRASTTILHGSIRDLAPLDALSAMLATTNLEHVLLGDGTILIRLKVTH